MPLKVPVIEYCMRPGLTGGGIAVGSDAGLSRDITGTCGTTIVDKSGARAGGRKGCACEAIVAS